MAEGQVMSLEGQVMSLESQVMSLDLAEQASVSLDAHDLAGMPMR